VSSFISSITDVKVLISSCETRMNGISGSDESSGIILLEFRQD
jgi:hypothetical protein